MTASALLRRKSGLLALAVGGSLLALVTAGTGATTSARTLPSHQPTAFVLAHTDSGLEGLLTASGEQYDNRAYPRQYISPAQSNGARQAFAKLGNSGKTGSGTVTTGTGTGGSAPLSGWTEAGPTSTSDSNPLLAYGGVARSISGRALAVLVMPGCNGSQCDVWVGTAGGGVWHTSNGLGATGQQAWQSVNDGLTSNAVSTLVQVDGVIYAGTGEPSGSNDAEAGRGLFRLGAGSSTWTLVPGSDAVANDRALDAVWVDPANTDHIVIGTAAARHGASAVWGGRAFPPGAPALGVYETTDGATFHALLQPKGDNAFVGGVTNLQKAPAGALYATVSGYGVYRLAGGTSTKVFTSASYQQPGVGIAGGRLEMSVTPLSNGKTRAYLGDSDTNGSSYVWRTDDLGAATPAWTQLSSKSPSSPGYAVYGYCEDGCGYNDFIVADPTNPDRVFVGGSVHYDELGPAYSGQPSPSSGRAVMLSTDGGASWTDMSQDATRDSNGQVTAMHPDQHALALVPGSDSFFETSDGGVIRADDISADRTGECATRGLTATQLAQCNAWLKKVPQHIVPLNTGLPTIQFQSLSTNANGDLLGGTQDNGTLSTRPGGGTDWFETIYGDGGWSGFDTVDPTIRYHTYYDATPDVNFHGSGTDAETAHWDWIGDPLQKETPSFYIPMLVDPVTGGTVWAGLQHVWRTLDHGGSQQFLDAHCNEFDYHPTAQPCGDWQATGGGGSGGTYYRGSAGDAGDLTGVYFGQDRKGEFVTQVSRAKDASTMWAGTRTGRVFITTNANNPAPQNVRYTRIDTPSTPGRFVSGITVDPADPNHAWVSYSGYSAYAAGGHVYEVRFNPATSSARWTDLSFNLGDIPITALVVNPTTRALYAGTDFGVAHLAPGAGAWDVPNGTTGSGSLPVVSVFSLLLSNDGHTLYAATHGRGAWRIAV